VTPAARSPLTEAAAVRTRSPVPSSRSLAKSQPRRAASGPQSLLILHLDAGKLREDGLYLGDVAQFSGMVAALALGSPAEVREATDLASLRAVLAELALKKRRFDVVVAIGHSNADGVRMARDHFARWDEFAQWVKPFKPRRLLLAACQAGRWSPGQALFDANPLLRRIYACPVNASKDFATMMLFAVPYVVANRRPRDKDVFLSQLAAIGATGRQLREWRATKDKGNPEGIVYDLLADLADPIARQLPGALGSLVRVVLGG
jgi:hypothetical protein